MLKVRMTPPWTPLFWPHSVSILNEAHLIKKPTTLKVLCASPESVNLFITSCIYINDHLVNARKDVQFLSGVKCQEYGHTHNACACVDKYTNCSSKGHTSNHFSNEQAPLCVLCGAGSVHPSTSPNCLIFIKKCASLDNCAPENTMLYFPTSKAWTCAISLTNPVQPASPLLEPFITNVHKYSPPSSMLWSEQISSESSTYWRTFLERSISLIK